MPGCDLMLRAVEELRFAAGEWGKEHLAASTTLANDLEALAKRLYPFCFKP